MYGQNKTKKKQPTNPVCHGGGMDSTSQSAGRPGGPERASTNLGRGSLQSPQVVLTETLLQREKVGDIRQQGGRPWRRQRPRFVTIKNKEFWLLVVFQ